MEDEGEGCGMSRRSATKSAPQDEPMPPGPHAKGEFVQDRALSTRAGTKYGWRKLTPQQQAENAGKIDSDEALAWEIYSKFYAAMGRAGKDSLEIVGGISGGGTPFTQAQVDAIRVIERIERRLIPQHQTIVRALCGEGYSMAEACKKAGIPARKTNETIRLALSKLCTAIMGARVF
jgi:hypothetical protein